MKKYKFVKTWINPQGKRSVVRADSETELWKKYYKKRFGLDGIESKIPENVIKSLISKKEFEAQFSDSFEIYAENYLERKKNSVSEDYYYHSLKLLKKHILHYIGYKPIRNITVDDCQYIMDNLKGSSSSLINRVHQLLTGIFKRAVFEHKIDVNPCLLIEKPKSKQKNKRRALSDNERTALLQACEKYPEELRIFKVMYFTGARPSEVRRMQRKNVFEENGKYFIKILGTKSESALRVVPIPKELFDDISGLKSNEYLVQSQNGYQMNKQLYKRRSKRLKREMNICLGAELYRNEIVDDKLGDFVPYDIRHDYCTRLGEASVDIRIAQRLMGHSSITLTGDIYDHISDRVILKNADDIIKGVTGCYQSM